MLTMKCYLIAILSFAISKAAAQYFNDVPSIDPSGFHRGIVIDAGSGGSRMHIYTWKSRIFTSIPPNISFPTANEQWTQRLAPGIASYADNPEAVSTHLEPLIEFAQKVLMPYQIRWGNFPIFFKATGGMRECPFEQREEIMRQVRLFLNDKTLCPFYFQQNFARVIAGEEEAVYAWTGVNFLMGTLLPTLQGTGMGSADPLTDTYGVLDLGGASTQIAFYVPSQDISEGLFQLAIGGQKHWNLYTKSFLGFGHVSARHRHLQLLVNNATLIVTNYSALNNAAKSAAGTAPESVSSTTKAVKKDAAVSVTASVDTAPTFEVITNPCFFSGYSEEVVRDTKITTVNPGEYKQVNSWNSDGDTHSAVLKNHVTATVRGPISPSLSQFDRCMDSLRPLMEKNLGGYCQYIHDGQCSIDGQYQPSLPTGSHFKFIGTSSYKIAWNFLMLPTTATLTQFRHRATTVCAMSYDQVQNYMEVNGLESKQVMDFMPYHCFMAGYNLVLLTDGYGFNWDDSLTVVDTVGGNQVGWPLGCILHEINMLPWTLDMSARLYEHNLFITTVALSLGIAVGLVLQYQLQKWDAWAKLHAYCSGHIKRSIYRIFVSDGVWEDASVPVPTTDVEFQEFSQNVQSDTGSDHRHVDSRSRVVLETSEESPLLPRNRTRTNSHAPRFTFIS